MNCDTVRFLMLDIGFIDCHLVNKLSILRLMDHHQKDLIMFRTFTELSVKMVKSDLPWLFGSFDCRILIILDN